MRVLVACEFSGVVREAFRRRGHDAWSCDLLPADDGSTYHWRADAVEVAQGEPWDLMIAHPPCTHLAVSGARWFKDKQTEQAEALADTVSVFRLEGGAGAPIDHHGVERRSPNRAINVARLKPAASVPAAPSVARSVEATPAPRAPKAVNADESWEEF